MRFEVSCPLVEVRQSIIYHNAYSGLQAPAEQEDGESECICCSSRSLSPQSYVMQHTGFSASLKQSQRNRMQNLQPPKDPFVKGFQTFKTHSVAWRRLKYYQHFCKEYIPLLPQSAQEMSSSRFFSRFCSFVPRQNPQIGIGSARGYWRKKTDVLNSSTLSAHLPLARMEHNPRVSR